MLRIFLVDDNAMMRAHLRAVLERPQEWTVVGEAENGRRAVEAWSEHMPSLTVMDFVMPEMSGLDVCRELRASRRTASIYVILLTARNDAADIVAGLRAGADDYVTKPVQAEELRARVQLGCRIIELRAALKTEVGALAVALAREKLLLNRLALIPERTSRRTSRKEIASVV